METEETLARLTAWFGAQLPDADHVAVDGLDRVEFGHSAETLLLTLHWRIDGARHRRDVVLRVRPPAPGLLEPYDLRRQFDVLRALEDTPVRAPRVLWFEGTGEVLGREFYVMERIDGTVYERGIPDDVSAAPGRIRRMCEGMVEQLAAIHLVDLRATGLDAIGDGRGFLDRELQHWASEMRRVQRGPLPALERLLAELRDRQPPQCSTVTLVHGDPKPGNFAFQGDQVSAVFDWEMTNVGDPLADIGWAEVSWSLPGSLTAQPGSPTANQLVAHYEKLTGITVSHREWYRAFQGFRMSVILLVGSMLFDAGSSDDLRFVGMAYGVPFLTQQSLRELGVDEELDAGPVFPREERVRAVRERTARARTSVVADSAEGAEARSRSTKK